MIARSIKANTEVIRDHTQYIPGIKNDTEKILEEIQGLRISGDQKGEKESSTDAFIRDYLDGLTSYAETVCEDVMWETDGEDEEGNEIEAEERTGIEDERKSANEDEEKSRIVNKGKSVIEDEEKSAYEDEEKSRIVDKEKSVIEDEEKNGAEDEGNSKAEGEEKNESNEKTGPEVTQDFSTLAQRAWKGPKCNICESPISYKALPGRICSHQLCTECIRSRFEASTRHPYPTVSCCEYSISSHQADAVIDNELKMKFNEVWGVRQMLCPRKGCTGKFDMYVLRSLKRRENIKCEECELLVCSWCGKKRHEKRGSKCKRNVELDPAFLVTEPDCRKKPPCRFCTPFTCPYEQFDWSPSGRNGYVMPPHLAQYLWRT